MRRRVFLAVGGFAALSAAGYLLLGSPVFSRDTWPVGEVCSYCGMKIVERKFAAELLVDGKRLAYDDPGCMVVHYLSFTGAIQPVQGVWPLAKVEKAVVYTYDGEEPVPAFTAWYVVGSSIRTPMLHGILAFKSLTQALEFARREGGDVTGWDGVVQHMLGDRGHETEAHDGHETANAFKIRLRRLDGGHVTVEELLREGRPVLLVFFATWCPTCSKNISTLWRAYQRFGGKVTVLLSSFDPGDTPSKINNFLTSHGVGGGWIVTEPNLDFLVTLRVITQETIFGISTSGEIVYEKRFGTLTEDEWLEVVRVLFSR